MPIKIRRIPVGEPGVIQMAGNAISALNKFTMGGFKVAHPDEVKRRQQICERCRFWASDSRMGLGKCMHHSCGCTRLKWRLATESCPIGKWSRVDMTS